MLPTAYFGPIEYYSILLHYPQSTIEQHEHFVKQTIRNRCVIYSSNGMLTLTIPLKRNKRSKTLIKDTRISYSEKWQKQHWKTIESSYNSSPFFEYYKEYFKLYFEKKYEFLLDFNLQIQNTILEILRINHKQNLTKNYKKYTNQEDLRNYNYANKLFNEYPQVFLNRNKFISNLSIIDLLFNIGNESKLYLKNIEI